MGVDQGQEAEPPSPYCSTTFRAKNHGARTFFLPEVREFIKDTRPKTNTTRGGRKAHRPTLLKGEYG